MGRLLEYYSIRINDCFIRVFDYILSYDLAIH